MSNSSRRVEEMTLLETWCEGTTAVSCCRKSPEAGEVEPFGYISGNPSFMAKWRFSTTVLRLLLDKSMDKGSWTLRADHGMSERAWVNLRASVVHLSAFGVRLFSAASVLGMIKL